MAARTYDDNLIMVSGRTEAHMLAGKVCECLREGSPPTLRAIGAGAVNQAVKACAIAARILAEEGLTLLLQPGFATVYITPHEGGRPVERSAVTLFATLDGG